MVVNAVCLSKLSFLGCESCLGLFQCRVKWLVITLIDMKM